MLELYINLSLGKLSNLFTFGNGIVGGDSYLYVDIPASIQQKNSDEMDLFLMLFSLQTFFHSISDSVLPMDNAPDELTFYLGIYR